MLEGLTTDEMLVNYPQEYQSFRNDGPDYQIPGEKVFANSMIVVREHLRMWRSIILEKKLDWLPTADFLVPFSAMY